MLTRLPHMSLKTTLRGWEVHLETACDAVSIPNNRHSLVVDFHALRSLVLQLPDHALEHFAEECGRTIVPVYNSMQKMIKSDFKHVIQVLSDLERSADDEDLNVLQLDEAAANASSVCTYRMKLGAVLLSQPQQRDHNWDSLCSQDKPQTGAHFQAGIPEIIIIPCEPQEQDSFCHVPLQNSAFGGQLTVPSHPVFNHTFPPLASTPHASHFLQDWTWRSGHWQATLPSIHEQATKGLFSKALTKRRKLRQTRTRP